MKSTKVADKQRLEYPCLMESTLTGSVVLFVDETEGMQVTKQENPEDAELGHYTKYWNSSHDSEFWKPFHGRIILENDQ